MKPGTKPGTVEHALALMEQLAQKNASLERGRREPIAIVGMACRFPGGANGPASYWRLLVDGRDAVTSLDRRWEWLGVPPPDAPRRAGLLREEEVEQFDAAFFEISDREARSLDPQQRMVLTVAWEALENAGLSPRALAQSATGVFIGSTGSEYVRFGERLPPAQRDAYFTTGAMASGMAGRLSYVLGLQGPAVTLDTACSSSLVATHLACQSLRAHETHLALAGGVNLILSPEVMEGIAMTRALSPDGRCRTFDAGANGFVRGEGCGVLVLKRLSDALKDGDRIWALVRGSAVNQDGRSTGLTAPNVLAQQRLLRDALVAARADPAQVDYVETHGTGTQLGDPIELEALRAVLGGKRADGSRCLLGAVKTNIGHLEAASGVASMMKAALALHHRTVPRNLGFEKLNPLIQIEDTALAVADRATSLPMAGRPLVAGVSAFGISGTNAHVLLEEAPPALVSDSPAPRHALPLLLSARTAEALSAQAARLGAHLAGHPELSLLDVAHTLAVARPHFEERVAVVVRDGAGALRALADVGPQRTTARSAQDVAVLFTGSQGGEPRSSRELYEAFDVFRESVDATCLLIGEKPEQVLLAPEGPALFALHVALFRLCESWGVRAGAVLGTEVGEIAAAHVAGALSLEDACRLVVARGRPVKLERVNAPALRVISSITAAPAGAESLGNPEHWAQLARVPARLAEGKKALEAEGFALLLELGPGVARADPLLESLASLHARGGTVDWAAFFSRLGGRRVELPPYPFQGRRHWFPAPQAQAQAPRRGPHPVLSERLSSAETGATVWSGTLDAAAQPWLTDHRVGGVLLCPAAAYLELMAWAFSRESGASAFDLEQVSVERPLSPAPGSKHEVQVVLHREGEVTSLALHSRSVEGGGWTRHAQAKARAGGRAAQALPIEALRSELERLPQEMSGADFYAQSQARGDVWGPAYKAVERLKYGGDSCLVQLRVTSAMGSGGFFVHPALLEACAQAISAFALSRPSAPAVPFLARSVARCRSHAQVRGETFWSRMRLIEASERSLIADVAIHDETGQLVVEIERLELEPLVSAPVEDPRSWAYARRWVRVEDGPEVALQGRWLFVGAEAELRRALEGALGDEAKARVTFAEWWQDTAAKEALSSEELRGVVFFARPDDRKREVEQAAAAVVEALAPLVELRAPAKLWWVTRGRWAVEGEEARPVVPAAHAGAPGDGALGLPSTGAASAHAALWGMGLSLSVEHATRWGGLIDLPSTGAASEEIARPFVHLLARGSAERQVALRGGATYAARLARLSLPAEELPALSPGAAYLVTGGLGGLGLKVAGWLADRGARHLVLMGRTGVPERRRWRELPPESNAAASAAAVRTLEARGVHVTVAPVDVADGAALSHWLEEYRAEERPPLRGVVHAAGVLEPAPALEVNADRLRRHLRPKLGGALELERALAKEPLDFFVLFSSGSAVVASPQLGEYAAANACLDAVAERRRAAGKPALSIAWGPWGEAGMLFDASRQSGRLFQVMGTMKSADALEMMGKLWRGPPCPAVLPIDWERWRTSYRVLLEDPFFAAFAGSTPRAPQVAPATQLEDVVAALAENLTQLLGRTEAIGPDESLLALGIDSLMAYDAQQFIEQHWHVEVPVLEFLKGSTVNEIAGFIRARQAPAGSGVTVK